MKSKCLKKTVLILLFSFNVLFAQEKDVNTFGFTAAFSGVQFDVLFPIRINNNFTISPGIGIVNIGNSYTELNLSLAPKIYLTENKVKPFFGCRGVYLNSSPKEGESVTDYLVGLFGGGEYFIDKQFSFGIESQLNFSISDKKSLRFGNPDEVNINTATIIFVSIYF